MQELAQQVIHVSYSINVREARRTARALAETIGFDEHEREEIALVVSELGSNLVKHAGGGSLILTSLADGTRVGLQIRSVDTGPGIGDEMQAIADGFSTTGSLGYGLGTVNRLMDEFDITSHGGADHGTRIVCKRWLQSRETSGRQCPLDLGVATRPYPGMAVNGDAFVIKRWGESVLVAVIDGLGHGQYAHRAAQQARQYVERHFDQPMVSIFRGVGRACHGTRGVVMALARFDWDQSKLTFATVGNIQARVLSHSEPVRFRILRGIIGANAPNPVVTEHHWDPNNLMALHSDGLTTRWQWKDFPHLPDQSATEIAQELLRALAKDNDDATVVVVRGAT